MVRSEVCVFGECLFDSFPDGKQVLGGAPFNVAWALQGLGHRPVMISAVGKDEAGKDILSRMANWGMTTKAVSQHPSLATGQVQVRFSGDEPSYEISYPRAWDAIPLRAIPDQAILYHGTLALRSQDNEDAIQEKLAGWKGVRFFDVNLRPPHTPLERVKRWLLNADWVKLNLDELAVLAGLPSLSLAEGRELMMKIREDFRITNLLLTAGASGAAIQGSTGEATLSPAPQPEPFVDPVGAGDAFTAVTIHGLQQEWKPSEILTKASAFASRVCSIPGATSHQKSFYHLYYENNPHHRS